MSLKSLNRPREFRETGRQTVDPGGVDTGQWICIGEVLRPHGVHGALSVRFFEADRLNYPPETIRLQTAGGDFFDVTVRAVRPHRRGAIVEVVEFHSRDEAEDVRGASILVPRNAMVPLGPEEWYLEDLRTCRVVTREGHHVGQVFDIWPLPHHDLLMVRGVAGHLILIPFHRQFVLEVAVEERRIVVGLPQGYLALYHESGALE